MWFTAATNAIGQVSTADAVVTSPSQGPAATRLTITGAGFSAGETVTVKYQTGLASPATVKLCDATAAGDGSFSCVASMPSSLGAPALTP